MAKHLVSDVPLYLIPQALSDAIKKYGDAIAEVRIKRTFGHSFVLQVKYDTRGDRSD